MSSLLTRTVFRLRRLASRQPLGAMTDRALLERFAERGDEEAFTLLVKRHAGLVLGVCRRVLGNVQDSEDAFQATFLVLARKAGSVAWQESVKNWLHGVAYRVSLKARRQALRRKKQEVKAAASQADPLTKASETWDDLRRVLDEELIALPSHYRAPLILCYLEGRTRDEAAEELGWSAGSVKGRLERGRELLRQRLLKRGLPLAAVLCAGLVSECSTAGPAALLIDETVRAGLQFVGAAPAAVIPSQIVVLAQGVLNAMLIAKLKISAVMLFLVGLLGLGGHWLVQTSFAREETGPAPLAARLDAADGDKERDERRDPPEAAGKKDEKKGDKKGDVKRDPVKVGDRDPVKKGERDGRKDSVRGAFVSFDAVKGLITLDLGREGDKTKHDFHLAGKDVPFVSSTGEKLRPASIPEKTLVSLTFNELNDVAEVRVEYPTAAATVKSVNVERGAITLDFTGRGEKSFQVPETAKLILYGKPAKLADFKEGVKVELTLDFDKSALLGIAAVRRDGDGPPREGPRDGDPRPKDKGAKEKPRDGDKKGRPDGRPDFEIHGVITLVNAKEGAIDILGGGEASQWIKTFNVPKDLRADVKMSRFSREMGLDELQKGFRISFNLAEDKKTIAKMLVWVPAVRVIIKAVDVAKGRIDTDEESFLVDKETKILVNGKMAGLADVMPGMLLSGWLSGDRSRLLALMAARTEADGRDKDEE